jgi:hypothetical protein
VNRLLPTSLLAVALGLGTIIVYQALTPVTPIEDPVARAAPLRTARPMPPAYVPPTFDQFAIINARPLFDPARHPVSEPERSGTASSAPPPLSLVGVAIGAGTQVALLKRADTQASISGRLGQRIEGWQIVRILPGSVIFRAGATNYTLKMRAAAGLPQPALNNSDLPAVTERPGP